MAPLDNQEKQLLSTLLTKIWITAQKDINNGKNAR
jgi:hypothetical protein